MVMNKNDNAIHTQLKMSNTYLDLNVNFSSNIDISIPERAFRFSFLIVNDFF